MSKYIFSINPGRSGSGYLAKLLSHADGCFSTHEDDPVCNGDLMQDFLHGKPDRMLKAAAVKAERIRQIAAEHAVYADSSHMFIKGFGWFMPEMLGANHMGVVILRRDSSEIARSTILNGASPLDSNGLKWIFRPTIHQRIVDPPTLIGGSMASFWLALAIRQMYRGDRLYQKNGIKRPAFPKWLQQFEHRCAMWYADEVYARGEKYRATFPAVTYHETTLERLQTADGVEDMMKCLGLSPRDTIKEVLGNVYNKKLGDRSIIADRYRKE